MIARTRLFRTPFFSFGGRPYCEERLAAYIHREHRRGRSLREILDDPYIDRCGGRRVAEAVLLRPQLIALLERASSRRFPPTFQARHDRRQFGCEPVVQRPIWALARRSAARLYAPGAGPSQVTSGVTPGPTTVSR